MKNGIAVYAFFGSQETFFPGIGCYDILNFAEIGCNPENIML